MTAAIVAAGIGAAAGIAGGVMASQSGKAGMKAQQGQSQLAMGYNAAAAAESYQKRLEAVAQANGITVNSYLQANPQLIQGYQQASDIIRETYGGGAQAATAASGTDPKLLSQWQGQYQRGSEALKGAESELGNLKQQLSGLQWDGSPQTAVRIKQLQDAYNQAQVKRDTLQKQVGSVQQQIQSAQAYTPAQAAKAATVGRAPQALMAGANQAIGALNNAGKYVLRGKNEAGNALTNAFMGSGKDIIRGTNQAMKYQQPFYDAGQTGLKNMTSMVTPGNNFQATDPSYQWRLQQGLQGAENSAAARGSQLSGATLKALNNYGQGAASQEFQASFGRNQQLAGMGQNAGNQMSQLQSDKGTRMADLRTGYGQNMGNLATGTASQMAGIKTNQGNVYTNLGQNLASQYNTGANAQAGYKTGLAGQLYQGTLDQGNTLANRELGNADFFANTYGQAGKENAQTINSLGQQQNQYYQQQGQNNQNMMANIANPLMQGLMLYGDNGNTQWRGNRMGQNSNKYGAGLSNVNWGGTW